MSHTGCSATAKIDDGAQFYVYASATLKQCQCQRYSVFVLSVYVITY